ncbi:MAG: hypothetical protein ABIN89_25265, partial [Chitinophagaceae bacterium]
MKGIIIGIPYIVSVLFTCIAPSFGISQFLAGKVSTPHFSDNRSNFLPGTLYTVNSRHFLSAAPCSINLTSAIGTDVQTICASSAISSIVYTLGGGATNASITAGALPSGVITSFDGTTFTISGTPSQTGTFNYSVTGTGATCTDVIATGTITINAVPPIPTIASGGPTTFCTGGAVTLSSSSASGNQWYKDGTAMPGETNATYAATTGGSYTVVVTTTGCASPVSAASNVTVNPIPPTAVITAGGPTTFCTGGTVTLSSSSASGNQWYLNGTAIAGATSQTYAATGSGNYTDVVTTTGCASPASVATTVTVNTIPPAPTITAGGPTTFCTGGTVTLTSSSAAGNQWYKGGVLIAAATNQTFAVTASGNYTVIVTTTSCSSLTSAATVVT